MQSTESRHMSRIMAVASDHLKSGQQQQESLNTIATLVLGPRHTIVVVIDRCPE